MESNRYKIIIVDDDMTNLMVVRSAMTDFHDVFTVPSGKKLFQLLEKVIPDMILLDVEMPEMNGYETMEILKSEDNTAGIPVIFLTAAIDPISEIKGLNLGAVDYITKPFSRELLLKRIDVHMLVEKQRKELLNYSQNLEVMVSQKTQAVFGLQNAILKTVAELVESRDNITGGHIERTKSCLSLFVDILLKQGVYVEELSKWDINLFVLSSQLHDVGKISIKDQILTKSGKLTDEEIEEMKKHTVYGMNIIKKIEARTPESVFLKHARIMAGSHHEKWDGSGYPFGLKGSDIPLQGRIMAIIDVYDALTSERPYKKAFSHEDSVDIIRSGIGTSFDPLLGDVFVQNEKEFRRVIKDEGAATYQQYHNSIALKSVSQTVAAILDARAGAKSGDIDRIRHYLTILVNALLKHERYKGEVSSWDISIFLLSAQLYDVGKIAVDDAILHKTGKLTDEEYSDAKTHADFGVKVIRQIQDDVDENSLLRHAEILAGSHHEKWDGTGYPLGLKGAKIPLQGRLMAIVDIYDALTSNRPNREKLSHQEAVKVIKNYSGTYFDPELVRVFLNHEKEFEKAGAAHE